jgi:hypothetical protein
MVALGWKMFRPEALVVVQGIGVLDRPFLRSFRAVMRAEGAVGFCKLFDLSKADIQLCDAMDSLPAIPRLSTAIPGSIAIVLGNGPSPSLVHAAVFLKQRTGNRRRLRGFAHEADAREWLSSETRLRILPKGLLASHA